jgi:hypothetical protein
MVILPKFVLRSLVLRYALFGAICRYLNVVMLVRGSIENLALLKT